MSLMHQMSAHRSPRGSILVWVVVGCLFLLPSLPLLCPVDQIWVAGVYDDGDSDDVVLAVTSGLSTLDRLPLALLAPVWVPVRWALSPAVPARSAVGLSAFQTRAPPTP
jgi:hypothetical protein